MHFHHLRTLQEPAARKLFDLYAGIEGEIPPHLAEHHRRIVQCCGGLPLALKLIGMQLRNKTSLKDWEVSSAAVIL